MFKFISQYASAMTEAAIYPLFSMFVFVIFFVVLLVAVLKMSKFRVAELSNIPLENNELIKS
jgi:cell division septal protein FtsQ